MELKIFAIATIVVALFFLYRIAYQKQSFTPKSNEDLPKKEPDSDNDIVGKSAFVRSERSHLQTSAATILETENQIEKDNIFAPANNQNGAIISPEELDEVFDDTTDLDIPPDTETDEFDVDFDEEAEELRQTVENDANLASGFTYEEMADAINNPSSEKAEVLYQMKQTDFFEQLVSSNEGKALQIKTVIDRHIQNIQSENLEENNNEYGDFNIADYLS